MVECYDIEGYLGVMFDRLLPASVLYRVPYKPLARFCGTAAGGRQRSK